MFRKLMPLLADSYRLIAPDYPGFGGSSAPPVGTYPYTFAAMADLIDRFAGNLGISSYVVYMQDYGGPVGLRLATAHPERVRGLVIQNAVASVEGWNPDVVAQLAPFWRQRDSLTEGPLRAMMTPEGVAFQYTHGASRAERVSPDAWMDDLTQLSRPGNVDLQLEMLYNYQDNVAQYGAWGAYLDRFQPKTLIVWGRNDPFFTTAAIDYFTGRLPAAEVHLYDAGHFALETHAEEIAAEMRGFVDRLD